jgi:hypothetical protein
MSVPDSQSYWIGLYTGVASAAGLVLAWFAYQFSPLSRTFSEFRAEIPAITRLVTNSVYLRAMPVLVLGAVVLATVWLEQPRTRLRVLAVTATVSVVAVIVGYWGAMLPFEQLAGGIR